MRIQTQWWEVCGFLKKKNARRDSPHLWKTRTSLQRNLWLVWIWPLSIHHLALSKSQRGESVNIRWANILRKLWKRSLRRRWKTRDGKDVCFGLVGKTTTWVNTAVVPGWVGGRALLLILAQGLRNFMNSSYQPEFTRLIIPGPSCSKAG